ncbi:hypothetical protein XCR1_1500008 [Xenorhabdus cabanillasii JM26]|uniref:Uncharacterized protein n=1 Tax=Xenorhabdus cabanillasii JM26 TaxID=1427517 RepID=W1IPR8_9GAMM|nr:hypothetical protein XCR1_1500008 [Xenorhabdus cabanillasii JM26]
MVEIGYKMFKQTEVLISLLIILWLIDLLFQLFLLYVHGCYK